mmetsp:Transcript_4187/g.17708  ORF Transcript_4187/g.17708 Transcript_4187/m.17708 type:complete len:215 (+) Transcript_4187:2365-3009(+)
MAACGARPRLPTPPESKRKRVSVQLWGGSPGHMPLSTCPTRRVTGVNKTNKKRDAQHATPAPGGCVNVSGTLKRLRRQSWRRAGASLGPPWARPCKPFSRAILRRQRRCAFACESREGRSLPWRRSLRDGGGPGRLGRALRRARRCPCQLVLGGSGPLERWTRWWRTPGTDGRKPSEAPSPSQTTRKPHGPASASRGRSFPCSSRGWWAPSCLA